jgi:hypothetical protein
MSRAEVLRGRGMQRLSGPFLLTMGMALTFGAATAVADSHSLGEDDVKAAYLYNFCKFIEWPEEGLSDEAEFIEIGILDEGSFAEILAERIREKVAQRRHFVVKQASNPGELTDCHVVFIGEQHGDTLTDQLAEFIGEPVLTVGESDGFAEAGGIVEFVREKKRLRFEVNIEAAHRAGIEISSQVLKLARKVHGQSGVRAD